MDIVLQTHGLTKRYGSQTAVDGLDITVERGDIYGFLGPNGAGKTTTLRMITGLARPSAGRVEVLGSNVWRQPALKARLGCLVESPSFYPHLSGAENLALVQVLKGRQAALTASAPATAAASAPGHRPAPLDRRREVRELLDLVGLAATGRRRVRDFSLGMRQRLGIAMALVGNPEMLILDEPTNGFDPAGMREMRQLLQHLVRERGITVLISSHLLHEVELVATKVGIIRAGRLVAQAPVSELRRAGRAVLLVEVSHPDQAAALLRERLGAQVEAAGETGGRLTVAGARGADVAALLVHNDLELHHLSETQRSLEDIFFHLTGSAGDDAASAGPLAEEGAAGGHAARVGRSAPSSPSKDGSAGGAA